MIRRSIAVGVISICASVCAVGAESTSRPEPRGRKDSEAIVLKNAIVSRSKVIQAAIKVVKGISPKAKHLNGEQLHAVHLLGIYRSIEARPVLLRVVRVARRPVKKLVPFVSGQTQIRSMFPLNDLPVAQSLFRIGLPAVRAIIDKIEYSKDRPDQKDLEVYAKILLRILGDDHVRAYMMEAKKHSTKLGRPAYEKLLAMLDVNQAPGVLMRLKIPMEKKDPRDPEEE